MLKRLPDGEFEVMKVIWESPPPITSLHVMERLDGNRKPQTVLTMLARLIEKGFLRSERVGKERNYTPEISERDYMSLETGDFLKRYGGNSLGSLVKALSDGRKLSEEDIRELREWMADRTDRL